MNQELLKDRIADVLGALNYREREIIRLRYGLADGYAYTLEEVGKIFSVTRERVRQIEAKAVRKLQHPIRSPQALGLPGSSVAGRDRFHDDPKHDELILPRCDCAEGETREECRPPFQDPPGPTSRLVPAGVLIPNLVRTHDRTGTPPERQFTEPFRADQKGFVMRPGAAYRFRTGRHSKTQLRLRQPGIRDRNGFRRRHYRHSARDLVILPPELGRR